MKTNFGKINFFNKVKKSKIETINLSGEFCNIRKLLVRDASEILDLFKDPLVSNYLMGLVNPTLDDLTMWLVEATTLYDTGNFIGWAVENKETHELNSIIVVTKNNLEQRSCDISFLGSNNKFTNEALKMVTKYLLQNCYLHRIQIKLLLEDIESQKLADNIGYQFEGIQRKKIYLSNEFHDIKMYAILDTDTVK